MKKQTILFCPDHPKGTFPETEETMKLIQELIDSAVRELEKGSRSSDMVGNLPYYPMFLTINGKHPETFCRTVKKRAGRTGPKRLRKSTSVDTQWKMELSPILTRKPVQNRK